MGAYPPVPEALRLPAGPLVVAVDQAAHDRGVSGSDLLGNSGQKAYARVRAAGTATLTQVEAVCDRLGCHPYELYGPAYQRLAIAGGTGPLEPEVTVTAWHRASCARPGCDRPIGVGEPVGLVAEVGPCCAACWASTTPPPPNPSRRLRRPPGRRRGRGRPHDRPLRHRMDPGHLEPGHRLRPDLTCL